MKIITKLCILLLLPAIWSALSCGRPFKDGHPVEIKSRLSEYGLLNLSRAAEGKLTINNGGLAYRLASPLFSDYALKYRTLHLPDGTHMAYNERNHFKLPVGTVITKTFAFPADFDQPDKDIELIETRLLIKNHNGWSAWPYIWNKDKSDALLAPGGRVREVTFKRSGKQHTFMYTIPSKNQCGTCHQSYSRDSQVIEPIGLKARHLNTDGIEKLAGQNQLTALKQAGLLEGAPDNDRISIDYRDTKAPLVARARAYLDINCAHCHNARSASGINSNLYLDPYTKDKSRLGLCKVPASAGKGGGGLKYDISPGKPAESVMWYRVATTEPGAMMPQLGRALVDEEGARLVYDWIAAMPAQPCESL